MLSRKLHPGHTCSATSSTPFGALVIQRGAVEARGLSDAGLNLFRASSTSHPPPPAAGTSQGCAGLGPARQFLFAEILRGLFPSIVCCPSDLLKPCVSYRFCLPALTSLFCSSKQTFSIYRSLHLTKRELEPWTWAAALSH